VKTKHALFHIFQIKLTSGFEKASRQIILEPTTNGEEPLTLA
jgi:hypothetical protein